MIDNADKKYSPAEWDALRKSFAHSILNKTEIAKLGQNVGLSWPFKGSDETPLKYLEFEFEELQSVPGFVGKLSRIKRLMDILRETLAFDDPFGEMMATVEIDSQEDDTFERILRKLEVPEDYPVEFLHFTEETLNLLQSKGVATLIDCVHCAKNLDHDSLISNDLSTFLNSLANNDEKDIALHIPYRKGVRGLHLPEAIGLLCENLDRPTQLHLLSKGGASLNEEELKLFSTVDLPQVEASLKRAQTSLGKLAEWFKEEAKLLEQAFSPGGSPERYFITINEPRREQMAVELSKLRFTQGTGGKSGLFRRFFGK